MRYIEDLREDMTINEIYFCRKKQELQTKAGKPYYSVTLQDKTGNLDGEPVNSIDGYFRALQEHKVGDKVEVTVLRDAFGDQEKKKMKLKLAKRK